jgi:hypothetical protein
VALTVTHQKVNNISDWTQQELDQQIALGFYPAGTTLADIAQPSDWNDEHEVTGTVDPSQNNVSTDGVTITGNGTPGNPISRAAISGVISVPAGSNTATLNGIVPVTNGGTGFGSFNVGDILYADTETTLQKLPAGFDGQVLGINTGMPMWTDAFIANSTTSISLDLTDGNLSAEVIPGGVNHNALANLAVGDVHTQYVLVNGRATPQQIKLGTASGAATGYISSTSNATKGKYFLNAAGTITVDEANTRLGVGTATPNSSFHSDGSFAGMYRAITAARTLDVTDWTVNCTAGTFAVTLPTAVGIDGRQYNIKNSGTGVITINTTSGQTVDGAASGIITLVQYDSITVVSNGANWIII